MFLLSPALRFFQCFFWAALCCVFFACNPEVQPDKPIAQASPAIAQDTSENTVADSLLAAGYDLLLKGSYPEAMAFFHQSMDSAAARGDSSTYYDAYMRVACTHERLMEFDKAIEIGEQVLVAYIRIGDTLQIGRGYTALASFYGQAKKTDKFIETARKGLNILRNHQSLENRSAAYNQMGYTFIDLGRRAEALPFLDTALFWMTAAQGWAYVPSLQLNLGNCHRQLGHWAEAEKYLKAALRGADTSRQAHLKGLALRRLYQTAEAQNNPALALDYYKKSQAVMDSLFNAEKAQSIQTLEVQYETAQKEQEIKLLRAEKQARQSRRNLILLGVLFVLSLLGYGLLNQRTKLRKAREALIQNKRDLDEYAQLLLAKNTRLMELEQNRLQTQDLPDAPDHIQTSSPLAPEPEDTLYNSRILTHEDWEIFKQRFDRALPGYLLRLRAAFPDLSGAEERLFLLIKINLTSQEIANLLGISPGGVKKGRQRLRKRLGLKPDVELEDFICASNTFDQPDAFNR